MTNFKKVKGWVFDIDDTLVLEHSYVLSGFSAVARWILSAHKIDGFYNAAVARFDAGARGNVFELAMSDLRLAPEAGLIQEMVSVYRLHDPKIELEPDASRLMQRLKPAPIGVISDGPLSSQSQKAKALNLIDIASPIILTDAWGREFWKPHIRAFRAIEEAWQKSGSELIYVADNPAKDFIAPDALGWQTIRVARPGGQHASAGETSARALTVRSLDEILPHI